MIHYDEGFWGLGALLGWHGSVLPKACAWSVSAAAITAVFHYLIHSSVDDNSWVAELVNIDTSPKSIHGFTVVFGFILSFRAKESYGRFVDGATALNKIRGEWFNSFSNLMAFCNPDHEKEIVVQRFQHQLCRLMSLLHAAAIQQLSSKSLLKLEIIDLSGFNNESLHFLEESPDRVEIVLQWVQKLIVQADRDGAIKIAPPILSRVYNQLGNGIVGVNKCRTINNTPMPFPFVQSLTAMLVIHWICSPLMFAASVENALWASIDCFLVQTCFWTLQYIAMELEFPFGADANCAPIDKFQVDLNRSLVALLHDKALEPPSFDFTSETATTLCSQHINLDTMVEDIHKMEKVILRSLSKKASISILENMKKRASEAERKILVETEQIVLHGFEASKLEASKLVSKLPVSAISQSHRATGKHDVGNHDPNSDVADERGARPAGADFTLANAPPKFVGGVVVPNYEVDLDFSLAASNASSRKANGS